MAIPVIAMVGGGLALVGGGLLVRKEILKKNAKAPASPASVAALPPKVQAVVSGPGAPVSQVTINTLAAQQAAGTLDIENLLKGTNGVVFTKVSPQMRGVSIPDDIAVQIQSGDTLTVDVDGAGISVPNIPSGQNMLMIAKGPADMNTRMIPAVSTDPRAPSTTVLTIPIKAITGIQP